MDAYLEIEIESLANAEESMAIPTTLSVENNDANLKEYLENLNTATNGPQSFNVFGMEGLEPLSGSTASMDIATSDWLTKFLGGEVDDGLVSKSEINFTEGDDEDEVISTGTITGDLGFYSGFGGTTATFDGDLDQGDPNGPPTDDPNEDVILVHGTRVEISPTSTFILRGSSSSFSFHHNGEVFDNESEWLEAIWDTILEIFADETPFYIPGIIPGVDLFETYPPSVQRGIIEFLCGCSLPTPE